MLLARLLRICAALDCQRLPNSWVALAFTPLKATLWILYMLVFLTWSQIPLLCVSFLRAGSGTSRTRPRTSRRTTTC